MVIILFHLQMTLPIFYFTYSFATRSSGSLCVNCSAFHAVLIVVYNIILSVYHGFNMNNYYAHYFKNVFAHKLYYYAYDSNIAGSFSKQLSCSEDANTHGCTRN